MKTAEWAGVVLCTLLVSLSTGCKKERMETRYFNCTINGEKFESPFSDFILASNTDPDIEFDEMGDSISLYFTSACDPVNNVGRTPQYVLRWRLNLPRSLTTHVRYPIATSQGFDTIRFSSEPFCELYFLETVKEEHPDPSFSVTYLEERRFLGTGFVEFSRIDFDKSQFDGEMEFEFLPTRSNPDSTRRLSLEGEWKILE